MNSSFGFMKKLFVQGEQPLHREEQLAALGLLWFCQLMGLVQMLSYQSPVTLIAQYQAESMPAYAIFTSLTSILFNLGVPWAVLLMLGCFGFIKRSTEGRFNLFTKILLGLLLYVGFRAIVLLPMCYVGFPELMSTNTNIQELIRQGILPMALLLWLSLIGATITLVFLIKDSERKPRGHVLVKELDRTGFIFKSFQLNMASIVLALILVALMYLVFDGNLRNPSLIILAGLCSLALSIISLVFMVRRIRNAGISYWIFAIYILVFACVGAGYLMIIATHNLFLQNVGGLLIRIGYGIPGIFFLALMLLPSKEFQHNADGREELPATETPSP